MNSYFERMIKLMNENKLSENDMYQLFQDMVNLGYAWKNPEISLHARMLIEKNIISTPEKYVHVPVTVDEVLRVQSLRSNNQQWEI